MVLAHTGRRDAMEAAQETCSRLHAAGLVPVMQRRELIDIQSTYGEVTAPTEIIGEDVELSALDLVMVLGGDGTILRAAELVRNSSVPLLGVNLGHVGFLAESERGDLEDTVQWVVDRDYMVEERMTIEVKVYSGKELIAHTWALNEAAVEKADRERMLEVVAEVDGRPISSFGCDGIVMATPTGSTAYAFSAGGPVVWPEVEALLMVPISAHALFAKPLVVAPSSVIAVETLTRTETHGVLFCDGRRTFELPPGSRVEVTKSEIPVRLARTRQTLFSERLVRKFELPTSGWRGPTDQTTRESTMPAHREETP